MAHSRTLDNIDPQVIGKRSEILRDLSQRKRRIYHEGLLGTEQTVLFEEYKNGFWSGLTDHYVRVNVSSAHDLTNRLLGVRLESIEDIQVQGELI
jgi:threonylcarbamoyladenosine tRNA methylthiotransferase MtaB